MDNQSGDIVLLEQIQGEQPGSLEAETINETISRKPFFEKKYRAKLKKLRKEQQKLHKKVKRIRRKIKEISVGKVPDKTSETVNAAIQTESYEGRATQTQTEPIPTQPVIIQKEQHAILVDVATQTEDVTSYSMAT